MRDKGLLKPVGPGTAGLRQPLFYLGGVEIGDGARIRAHQELYPGERLIRDLGIESRYLARERGVEDAREADADLGAGIVARPEDEAGDEGLERDRKGVGEGKSV